MLGDDVIDGTKKGISIVGNAVRNAVKGALLFAAVAATAAVVYGAGAVLLDPTSVADIAKFGYLSSIVESVKDIAPHAAEWALGAAKWGAIVAGGASLLPGSEEGLSLSKLFHRNRARTQAREHQRQPEMVQVAARRERPVQYETVVQQPPVHTETRYETVYRDAPPVHIHQAAPCPPQTIIDNSQRTEVFHSESPTFNKVKQETNNISVAPDAEGLPQNTAQNQTVNTAPLMDNPLFRDGKGAEMLRRSTERSADPALAR